MRAYIEKLQQKPEHIRKQILFGSMVVCMSFVALVWIGGLGSKFSKKTSAQAQNEIKPFALFGRTISDTYNNISASVGSATSSIKKEQKVEEKVKTEKQIDLIPVEYE